MLVTARTMEVVVDNAAGMAAGDMAGQYRGVRKRKWVKVIGCSSLRGGGGKLGTNKNLDLWLQLVCTKFKLKHAI